MKLYGFDYSCYVRKTHMVLDLLGVSYHTVDVPFGDRTELVALTGGYVQVPVLVLESGEVITDSRNICRRLVERTDGQWMIPTEIAGPVWAYADWCDNVLEDVMFRLASPGIRNRFERAADKAMFTFIKERKYGAGCVDQWQHDRHALLSRAVAMLEPTLRTLTTRPFVFGDTPTLADAALYGQLAMVEIGDASLPAQISPTFVPWMRKLEQWRR